MAVAGDIHVKVVPDLQDFPDEALEALAEKVAARIVEKNMLVQAYIRNTEANR